MINCETTYLHHFFEVTIAEGITQIPAYTEKDDLGLVVSPFEQIGFGQSSPPVIMELGQSTSIEDQMSGLFATEPLGRIFIGSYH
jgi:hypothetical protein